MATEKKTTAKKTTAKKAACKKTACKKTTKAATVKHIGLVKNDPYLADYEDAIRGRHDHVLWKMGQLTNNGKTTLSDLPMASNTSAFTRQRRDGCSVSGRLTLQISISSAISTTGRRQRSIVPRDRRTQATGS